MFGNNEVDQDHIDCINAFIPQAIRYANKKMDVTKMRGKRTAEGKLISDEWSKIYLSKMNELTIAAGLRVA